MDKYNAANVTHDRPHGPGHKWGVYLNHGALFRCISISTRRNSDLAHENIESSNTDGWFPGGSREAEAPERPAGEGARSPRPAEPFPGGFPATERAFLKRRLGCIGTSTSRSGKRAEPDPPLKGTRRGRPDGCPVPIVPSSG